MSRKAPREANPPGGSRRGAAAAGEPQERGSG